MNTTSTYVMIFLSALFFGLGNIVHAQVGINTTSPEQSAALEVRSTDKGFLMPKVSLTGTDDTTTITPSATVGLMVYNTNTTSGATMVTPGFYYWSGTTWRKLKNKGYALRLEQTAAVTAASPTTATVDLPGLDTGNFVAPFTGTYQIMVTAYYSAADKLYSNGDGASQGSVLLVQQTGGSGAFTNIRQQYVRSASKETGGVDMQNLGQSTLLVKNVELIGGTTYRFKVQGREWEVNGCPRGAVFGRDTSVYTGAGGVTDAQRGLMTITLVKQL